METLSVECKYIKDREKYNGKCYMIDKLPTRYCNTMFCSTYTNVTWTFFLIYREHLVEARWEKRIGS